MEINLFGLIKFGQEVHMKELLEKGILYMNHLSEFLKIEDNTLRGDKHEGLSEVQKVHSIKISYQGKEIAYADIGRLSLWHNELSGNIFSMYTLFSVERLEEIKIDGRCKEFGDTFVFVTNVYEFLSRVKKEASKQSVELIYGPVEYINTKEYLGRWSVFKKPAEYSFQKEFRFFLRTNNTGPFCLKIGSIEDIAILLDSDCIDKLTFGRR